MNANVNPFYFEAAFCECCKNQCNLYKNRYTDNMLCLDCLNNILRQCEENKKQTTGELPVIDIKEEDYE